MNNTQLERALANEGKKILALIIKDMKPSFLQRGLPRFEIALLPNRMLRTLKKRFLGKDQEIVDVLAFPASREFPHPEIREFYLGEVYINASIARTDGARARFLLIHGILHLLGFDHEKKKDWKTMENIEIRIYNALVLKRNMKK